MRSQIKKTDFPDKRLGSVDDRMGRWRTDPRLSGNHKRLNTVCVCRHDCSLSFLVFGAYYKLSIFQVPDEGDVFRDLHDRAKDRGHFGKGFVTGSGFVTGNALAVGKVFVIVGRLVGFHDWHILTPKRISELDPSGETPSGEIVDALRVGEVFIIVDQLVDFELLSGSMCGEILERHERGVRQSVLHYHDHGFFPRSVRGAAFPNPPLLVGIPASCKMMDRFSKRQGRISFWSSQILQQVTFRQTVSHKSTANTLFIF